MNRTSWGVQHPHGVGSYGYSNWRYMGADATTTLPDTAQPMWPAAERSGHGRVWRYYGVAMQAVVYNPYDRSVSGLCNSTDAQSPSLATLVITADEEGVVRAYGRNRPNGWEDSE